MRQTAACLLFILSVMIAGCGAPKDLANTDLAVSKFHAQLDAGSFQQIYDDSGDAMKNAAPEKRFIDFLSAVHRKLGFVKSASRRGFHINWRTSGKTVTVSYATRFDQDIAEEQFVFHVSGDDAQLIGYHINSDALVTK
jgi:hypothetical protein